MESWPQNPENFHQCFNTDDQCASIFKDGNLCHHHMTNIETDHNIQIFWMETLCYRSSKPYLFFYCNLCFVL